MAESRRRVPRRAPDAALVVLLELFTPADPGTAGPAPGRLFAVDGDGKDWDGALEKEVWTFGGGGLFSLFCSGADGREDTAVAILASGALAEVPDTAVMCW